MNDLKKLQEKINQINWHSDSDISDFIRSTNSDIYTGKNELGETVIFEIIQNKCIKKSTYQSNEWIRTDVYNIDEECPSLIIREVFYEK